MPVKAGQLQSTISNRTLVVDHDVGTVRQLLSGGVRRFRVFGMRDGYDGNDRQAPLRSEEHTSELQSRGHLVCRLLLEKKKIECMPQKLFQSNSTSSDSAGKKPY